MIVGLFLRHFKIYQASNYIPFGIKKLENLNLFIGPNGAGKSSILEALDTFFNNRPFIITNDTKKTQAFVAPLFLFTNQDLSSFTDKSQQIIKIVSEVLYSVKYNAGNHRGYQTFFDQRKKLQENFSDSYLFLYGHWPEALERKTFITFDDQIQKKLIESGIFVDESSSLKYSSILRHELLEFYSYHYIPVETSVDDFLRLESKEMQQLMSENVKKRIAKTLSEKLSTKSDLNQSLLDIVNDDLNSYVDQVESIIQGIEEQYDFDKEYKQKTRITANHLTDVLIEAFFSKRKLKKSKKPIKFLSAGERRKALIDIAYALLIHDNKRKSRIILGIDEPESSLHISMCYDQFQRLELLANNHNHQVFITTHWYGALPIIENGNVYHVDSINTEAPQITQFSFKNYFEERINHPQDIHFKSFFDLTSALISSLRIQENNWLIVESDIDKQYLLKHIENVEKLKILPVGGSSIIKIIYDYLYTPLSQKSDAKDLRGKIFCLIDTDIQGLNVKHLPDDLRNNILKIRRLQLNSNDEIELCKLDTNSSQPTEIEETLDSATFYDALNIVINGSAEEDVKKAWSRFNFDNSVKNSFVKGDNSIIYFQNDFSFETVNPRIEKQKIVEFIENNKRKICQTYCSLNVKNKPKWISKIEDFFNK